MKNTRRDWITVVLFLALLSTGALRAEQRDPLPYWGAEAREAVQQFYAYDESIPLEARIVEKKESADEVREKIVFRSTQGNLVPGYLQFPRPSADRVPVVLLLHGWSGSKDNWFEDGGYISGGNVRRALLEHGFAILALDAQCHGDRIALNDFAPVNHYAPPDTPQGEHVRKGYFTLREIYMQTVLDYRRALDYLATRGDIDANRIGLIGYSMGATQSFILTAIEPRIKVTVACAVPADRNKLSLLAPQNYARSIEGTPFLMIMGSEDTMCPVDDAKQIFEMIGSPVKGQMFFDSGHKITPDYVPHAIEWIKSHL